jgi:serine/threonine protein kinase
MQKCFELPLVGGMFQYCFGSSSLMKYSNSSNSLFTDSVRSVASVDSSILVPHISAGDGSDHLYCDDSNTEFGSSSIYYAMKSIHLSRVNDHAFVEELLNEISILKTLDHPHIVRAIETYEHRNQIFIVMELCYGGDLYTRDPYTEEDAARIVSSILSAVSYMHDQNFIHRDCTSCLYGLDGKDIHKSRLRVNSI